jgi:hypothetical protein
MLEFVELVIPAGTEFTLRRVQGGEMAPFILLTLGTTDRQRSARRVYTLDQVRAGYVRQAVQEIVDEMAVEIAA